MLRLGPAAGIPWLQLLLHEPTNIYLLNQTFAGSGRVKGQSPDGPEITTSSDIVSAEGPCCGPEDTWQLCETLLRRPESSLQTEARGR